MHGTFDSLLRSKRLEQIGYEISDNPLIHDRIRNDAIKMNRKHYEFLVGTPDLHQYYVHNIFRDIFGLEKLYDYDLNPETKFIVPDLHIASAGIDNFRAIMVSQTIKVTYKVNRTISVKNGITVAVVELLTFDHQSM